jgi:hypothetical protein
VSVGHLSINLAARLTGRFGGGGGGVNVSVVAVAEDAAVVGDVAKRWQ